MTEPVSFASFDVNPTNGVLDREEVSEAHRQGCIWAKTNQTEAEFNAEYSSFIQMMKRGDKQEQQKYVQGIIDEFISEEKLVKINEDTDGKQLVTQEAYDALINHNYNCYRKNIFMSKRNAMKKAERDIEKNYEIMSDEERARRERPFINVLMRMNNLLPPDNRFTEEDLRAMIPDRSDLLGVIKKIIGIK